MIQSQLPANTLVQRLEEITRRRLTGVKVQGYEDPIFDLLDTVAVDYYSRSGAKEWEILYHRAIRREIERAGN